MISAPDVRTPGWCPADSNTKTLAEAIVAPAFPVVNATRHATRPVDEMELRRQEREAAEQARSLMFRRNCAAISRIAKYSLGWGRCRGALDFKPPKFHRIESDLGRMCFELPPSSPDGRVLPRTILGTLVGHDSKTSIGLADLRDAFLGRYHAASRTEEKIFRIHEFKLQSRALQLEYLIDDAGIDRRVLFEGRFLFDENTLERMLDPRCLTARDDYAARLYLALRHIGFPQPKGRGMRTAIVRIEEWARVNAVPEWLRTVHSQGGAE